MRIVLVSVISILIAPQVSQPPGAWLDSTGELNLSTATLQRVEFEGTNPRCDATTRSPRSVVDRAVVAQGWKLTALAESRRGKAGMIEIVGGFRQYDGMCRPLQFQAFVFIDERLVGTLSPGLMNSREDGALDRVTISDSGEITATFLRYTQSDALCCPSRLSTAVYSSLAEGGVYRLKLLRVETKARATP